MSKFKEIWADSQSTEGGHMSKAEELADAICRIDTLTEYQRELIAKAAAELEKANEAFAARQEWWNSRMFELEQKVAELEAEAKRLDFVESRLFGKSWNGVIDSGSRTYWRIASDHRHITQKMVGHTFRDALDNAMKEQP
jgi:hypothetical protein